MWPWDHLAVGYVTFSVLSRVGWGDRPSAGAAVAVVVGTQFPDLVDKPLGWWLGVLPGGTTLAHSLLTAVPVCLAVVLVGRAVDRPRYALAFTVGYLTHVAGDVFYPVALGGGPSTRFLLWPLVPALGDGPSEPLPYLTDLLGDFLSFLATPLGAAYLAAEVALLTVALWLWLRDGRPGSQWRPSPE